LRKRQCLQRVPVVAPESIHVEGMSCPCFGNKANVRMDERGGKVESLQSIYRIDDVTTENSTAG
jgi:hypothetical protein